MDEVYISQWRRTYDALHIICHQSWFGRLAHVNTERTIKSAGQQLSFLVADTERSIQLLGENNRLIDVGNVLGNRASKAMRFVTEDISVISHIVEEVQRIGPRALNVSLPSVLCITNKLRENMVDLLQLGESRQGSETSFIAVLFARSRNVLTALARRIGNKIQELWIFTVVLWVVIVVLSTLVIRKAPCRSLSL